MTRQGAINQFCRACIYDKSQPGTWRQQVTACGAKMCPLYGFRPLSQPRAENRPTVDLQEEIDP